MTSKGRYMVYHYYMYNAMCVSPVSGVCWIPIPSLIVAVIVMRIVAINNVLEWAVNPKINMAQYPHHPTYRCTTHRFYCIKLKHDINVTQTHE